MDAATLKVAAMRMDSARALAAMIKVAAGRKKLSPSTEPSKPLPSQPSSSFLGLHGFPWLDLWVGGVKVVTFYKNQGSNPQRVSYRCLFVSRGTGEVL